MLVILLLILNSLCDGLFTISIAILPGLIIMTFLLFISHIKSIYSNADALCIIIFTCVRSKKVQLSKSKRYNCCPIKEIIFIFQVMFTYLFFFQEGLQLPHYCQLNHRQKVIIYCISSKCDRVRPSQF